MPSKIIFTDEQLAQITILSNNGMGSRKISAIMGCDRKIIQNAFKQLGLEVSKKKSPGMPPPENLVCHKCKELKPRSQFILPQNKKYRICIECQNIPDKRHNPSKRKITLTEQQMQIVLEMYNAENGQRKIAIALGVHRCIIKRIYKELNLNTKNRTPRYANKDAERTCKICNILKPIAKFSRERRRYSNGELYWSYSWECKECESSARKTLNVERPDIALEINILRCIRQDLKHKSKNSKTEKLFDNFGTTMEKILDYTMKDLVKHIEMQFEDWMSWENYGSYRIDEWNDNDLTTYKWNIDHIIPRADLPYTSIYDKNFIKCWDLSNLRPYNAKQNQIDGGTRIRHKSKSKKKE